MTDPMILVGGVSIITIVTGLTQLFKRYVPNRFAPLVPLVFGIGMTFLVNPESVVGIAETIVVGLVVGMMSGGAYSGGKKMLAKPNPTP